MFVISLTAEFDEYLRTNIYFISQKTIQCQISRRKGCVLAVAMLAINIKRI